MAKFGGGGGDFGGRRYSLAFRHRPKRLNTRSTVVRATLKYDEPEVENVALNMRFNTRILIGSSETWNRHCRRYFSACIQIVFWTYGKRHANRPPTEGDALGRP